MVNNAATHRRNVIKSFLRKCSAKGLRQILAGGCQVPQVDVSDKRYATLPTPTGTGKNRLK